MSDDDEQRSPSEFDREASSGRSSLVGEFWQFLRENKKWWLLPMLIALLLVGVLIVLAGLSVAPFIYTLF